MSNFEQEPFVHSKFGKPSHIWKYPDEDGKELYAVVRWDTKDGKKIRQCLADGLTWRNDGRQVLYNLPEVIKSNCIFIAEGEKCADMLEYLEFKPATTNPDGAGKWMSYDQKYGISKPLHGKTVYILPDNDDPGRKHAEQIAASLYGKAKIFMLKLMLPEKGDICDYVKLHGKDKAITDIVSLIGKAKPWQPPTIAYFNNNIAYNINNNVVPLYRGEDENNKDTPHVLKSPHLSSFVFTEGHRDESLFHVANCLIKGGMHPQHIEIVLQMLARQCQPPFPQNEICAKIQSALERTNEKNLDITKEIRELILSSNGFITSSFVYNCLHLSSRESKKLANQALNRLVKQGFLEKVPDRIATFRVVDKDCDEIDFKNGIADEYKIKLPFGIERYVKIMPGNIIVVAGEVDCGKTAFCLNVAKLNMHNLDVHYFSSEMGAGELVERLSKDDLQKEDWKFKVWDRSDQFQDVIKPDALNIIDYLEEPEEIYKVTARIKQIHKKLKMGISVIALQKPRGRDEAVGGRGTLEKPRLYITLGRKDGQNIAKIVKAKNRRNGLINPNGMTLKFKLIEGIKFVVIRDWGRA